MKIGLTFDLRKDYLERGYSLEETAELDSEETIQGLERSLAGNGFRTERIGALPDLCRDLERGKTWDLVFNIAEGLHGLGRESAVPAVLDAWRVPYVFSDPMVLALTLHKGATKRVVRDLGLATPGFFLVERPEDVERIDLAFPLFAKPAAEGTGKGIEAASRVWNRDELEQVCAKLLDRFKQPVLVEEYLPGREFTVGVVGTGPKARVVGVMEVLLRDSAQPGAYTYSNKADYERVCEYRLVSDQAAEASAELTLAAYRGLGLRDAGRADIRLDKDGRPSFMEINALPGLNPVHSDLPIMCSLDGLSHQDLIGMIMDSALERIKGAR